jgi:hypothetical protein
MTSLSSSTAVLFANICNSLWLYEYLDDRAVRTKIEQCNTLLDNITCRHGGQVVKSIGENMTCSFPAAANALEAAMTMQQEMAALAARDSDALHIKIGLHFGEAIHNGGSITGDAVNVATRMAEQAAPNQIITTQRTVDSLPPELRTHVRFLTQTTVKDNCDDKYIFEVIWEIEEAVTRMPPMQRTRTGNTSTLTLRYAGQELTLTAQLPSTMVGRDKSCGIVVNDPLASRNHARIELRDGKFILLDQSTNGTYLNQGGKSVLLRGEERLLTGSGFFAMGHEVASNSPDAVQYSSTS